MAKLPSLPLFTDKFIAETVHLTNEALGMYIRLLCFAWTKKAEPFTEDQAYRICQCRLDECKDIVNLVLKEFFIEKDNKYTQKRITEEFNYLTKYYEKKSENGKKGAETRWHTTANGKTEAPTPIPIPIPKDNIYDSFETFWTALRLKKGSKKYAFKIYKRECSKIEPNKLAETFNKFSEKVTDKQFVPYISTWLNQRRFEDEINNKPTEVKMPIVEYKGEVLRQRGEFGFYYEYIDAKGNKYQKHKFKPNAKIEPIN